MRQIRYYIGLCGAAMLLASASAAGQTADDPNDLLAESRALRRRFMTQTASAVSVKTPQEEDVSLMQLIEQVMSLRTPVQSDATTKPVSEAAAAEAIISVPATSKTPQHQTPAAAPQETLSGFDVLRATDRSDAVLYPAELANILYRAGQADQAARYYEMALAAVDPEDVAAHQWLLFQTANCLRQTDRARAVMLYEELIRRYPNSVWAAAAQARSRIVTWKETRQEELNTQLAKRDANE